MNASRLDIDTDYQVDGLGDGHWRPVWWSSSEVVFIDHPGQGIKAQVALHQLAVVGPTQLRYLPSG